MSLDVVTFPALIIADDGWVQEVSHRDAVSFWSCSAIAKYNRRRVIIYDSKDCVWEVVRIAAQRPLAGLGRLLARLTNRKLQVEINLHPVGKTPLLCVQRALVAAIDADDDILTQFSDPSQISSAVLEANSFQSIMAMLKSKRAV